MFRKSLLFHCLLGLAALPAAAFHPMITEEVGLVGLDVRQAEIAFDHTEDTDAADYFWLMA
jgi:hypothetical protein